MIDGWVAVPILPMWHSETRQSLRSCRGRGLFAPFGLCGKLSAKTCVTDKESKPSPSRSAICFCEVLLSVSYVESNLLNGEEVVYRARLHRIVFAPSVVLGAFALLLVLIGATSQDAAPIAGIGAFLLLCAGLLALEAYIKVSTSEFAVTNRRVLIKVGLLRRTSLELLLPKVESIAVDQGLFGRMLDFGTIGIRGTGGSREGFANIAAPLEFRRQVQALLPE